MRKISKIIHIALLFAIMAFCLTACEGQKKDMPSNGSNSETVTTSKEELQAVVDEAKKTDESADAPETGGGNNSDGEGSRVLVAYFSATGTTKKLAEYAAEVMGADLYEIVPEEPYTDADLNYNDRNSRTSIEMNDKSIKPAINGSISDMAQYDIVFIGYPIWWGVAPTVVNTFLEKYDLAGKTVVTFATSGGSGMGNTNAELVPSCKGARVIGGKVFRANVSGSELKKWFDSIA